jgi:hypothetical protein
LAYTYTYAKKSVFARKQILFYSERCEGREAAPIPARRASRGQVWEPLWIKSGPVLKLYDHIRI